jgi:hypothetical protein
MMPNSLLRVMLAVLLAHCTANLPVVCEEPRCDQRSIEGLIKSLDSKDFRERDKASRDLGKRDEAFLDLHLALPNLSAEGKNRANRILREFAVRKTPRILKYARDGRVDLLVEWLDISDQASHSQAPWQCTLDISRDLLMNTLPRSEFRDWTNEHNFPQRTLEEFRKESSAENPPGPGNSLDSFDELSDVLAFAPKGVNGRSLNHSVILTPGQVSLTLEAWNSVIIANGNVELNFEFFVLIIADGDVAIRSSNNAVIVTRGRFLPRTVFDSIYIREDRASGAKTPASGGRKRRDGAPIVVGSGIELLTAQQRAALGRIKFFELADIGLKLVESNSGVRVDAILHNTPVEQAGLLREDLVLDVNGKRILTSDEARREFRRAFLLGGAVLKIHRNGTIRTLRVSFDGWNLPKR